MQGADLHTRSDTEIPNQGAMRYLYSHTFTCMQQPGDLGIEPPTLRLVEDPLYLLSHSSL